MSEALGAAALQAPASVPGPSLQAVSSNGNAVKGALTGKRRDRVVEFHKVRLLNTKNRAKATSG